MDIPNVCHGDTVLLTCTTAPQWK